MVYGIYLSATGVITSSHRQDVIANNLANLETTGFKRALSLVQQRPPESRENGRGDLSNPILDEIGGGLFLSPTQIDRTQGLLLPTESTLNLAVFGEGYFAVRDGEKTRLTRNGNFMLDRNGTLILSDASGKPVLDVKQKPITLDATKLDQTSIGRDGTIAINGQFAAQIGVFDVEDPRNLVPVGGTMLAPVGDAPIKRVVAPTMQSGYLELSNVDPATELTQLMDAQRQLEANANMIRFQDQTLGRLVNDVGKIS